MRVPVLTTDSDLVQRTQSGDRAALDALCSRYLPSLWRFIYAQLRPNEPLARDVLSDTFLAAIAAIHSLDLRRGSVAAWLTGIARHKLADARRRQPSTAPHAFLDAAIAPASDPTLPLADQETRDAVLHAMAILDPDERVVLEWKYLEGLSARDIAGRLGRTERAAESLLLRARDSFRHLYDRPTMRSSDHV